MFYYSKKEIYLVIKYRNRSNYGAIYLSSNA
jgi:hypothetical protein